MEPVPVNRNAGPLDTIYALLRYIVVIIGAVPLLLKLLGAGDVIALIDYFRSADGSALIAAISAVVALLWGLFKTFRRGNQVASAAANPKVKDLVLKD